MIPKVILNKNIHKYAVVVPEQELIKAISNRLHKNPTDVTIAKGQVPIKYESSIGVETCHIPYVINKEKPGPWHYDILPEKVIEHWSISKKEFKEKCEEVKQRSKFFDEIKKRNEEEKDALLEDKIDN